MKYSLYYYVPEPYSQKYVELDKNLEYVYDVGDGAFVDKNWMDNLE